MIIMITRGVFKIEVGSGQSIGDGKLVIALRSVVFVIFILSKPDQTALGIGEGSNFFRRCVQKTRF